MGLFGSDLQEVRKFTARIKGISEMSGARAGLENERILPTTNEDLICPCGAGTVVARGSKIQCAPLCERYLSRPKLWPSLDQYLFDLRCVKLGLIEAHFRN